MGRAGGDGQGVFIFILGLGCGVQATMGTEESLGLGQAQCCRQEQTGFQQAALPGQRIQTGPEFEQGEGLSSPLHPWLSSPPHPTRPCNSLFAGLSLAVAGQLVPPRLSHPLSLRARPSCCWRRWFIPCLDSLSARHPVPGWCSIPSPRFSLFSLHLNSFPVVPNGNMSSWDEGPVPAS